MAPLQAISPSLILVFGAPQFFDPPGLAEALAAAFPDAQIVGCSTAGEISVQGVTENRLVVTALAFERIRFNSVFTDFGGMADSAGAGRRLAERLAAPDLSAVFLLAEGVDINGSELIAGAVGLLGHGVPLTGGLAGDNGAFARTYVLCDGRVSDRMVAAVGFYGEHVGLSHGSFGGWQSFGPVRRATRTVGNVLHELDGEPALNVYKRYLGEYARDLPASGLLFPFAVLDDDHAESGLIRTLLGVNEADGSLVLAGDVPQGGHLRLMHASTDALVDGAEAAAAAASRMFRCDDQALAILVSCIGRKLVMGTEVDAEVEAVGAVFGSRCVLTGFYSNGEISPFLGTTECRLHNQTMTVTYLAER